MRQTAMPPRVPEQILGATEHPRSALGTPAIRRFDWARPPVTLGNCPTSDRRGRELEARRSAPARSTAWPASRTSLRSFWSIRPNGKSEPNWSPPCAQTSGEGSRLYFEWIAFGCTARSFWTASWHSIRSLESQLRHRCQGRASADSIESRIGVWPDSSAGPDPAGSR
jgi:hypothetical protein